MPLESRWAPCIHFLTIATTGCAAARVGPSSPAGYPAGPTAPPVPALSSGSARGAAFEDAPQEAPARGVPAEALTAGAPVPSATARTATQPEDAELVRAKRMVDIEAHLRIEVERVEEATEQLRTLASRSEGWIASESTAQDAPSTARAEFTLRVPIGKADDTFRRLDALGVTRARDVRSRDVGKEYYDSVLRLRNLEVTRDRLEQVLKQASAVTDILTIEKELTRVRGEMEQIEGQLRYMTDRAAFATIFVTLFVRPPDQAVPEVVVKPQAKFFPGVEGAYLLDVRGAASTAAYYGAGIGVGLSRSFDLKLDGFRRLDHAQGTLDALTATLGGRFYSEYLGGGTRRFLDPYLGLRGGYARFEHRNEIVLGIAVGVELLKSETVRLDLGAQGLVLFGTSAGAHSAVVPTLGVDAAF